MTEHLPECYLAEPCSAEMPQHGFCSRQSTWCIHCERECMCARLRACEKRVIDAAREAVLLLFPKRRYPDEHAAICAAIDAQREGE